ncbi:MAG: hypothetical protein ACEQSB_00095 [Undibacterium sp.]
MDIEEMIANSYRNFHTKGLDYLCVKRSETHTRKVYFFEGDASQLPEVVNPHDHRYDFQTTLLSGRMSNSIYEEVSEGGEVYNEMEYRTPLNGGAGFRFAKVTRLYENQRNTYRAGKHYYMQYNEIHTIRIREPGTVIVLDQYADIPDVGVPTKTFFPVGSQRPSFDGLYDRFTADQILARLAQYNQLMNNHHE